MEGNFRDSRNDIVGIIILIVGLIVMPIIQVKFDLGFAFTLIGVPVMVFLMFAVDSVLSKSKFSADEKLVDFSVGFKKYRYFYTSIINIRTEIIFTEVRGRAKIPHIELVFSLRNGKIVRFSDTVPSDKCDTIENLKKYQEKHQFTKLAYYIKSRL